MIGKLPERTGKDRKEPEKNRKGPEKDRSFSDPFRSFSGPFPVLSAPFPILSNPFPVLFRFFSGPFPVLFLSFVVFFSFLVGTKQMKQMRGEKLRRFVVVSPQEVPSSPFGCPFKILIFQQSSKIRPLFLFQPSGKSVH